MRVTTPLLAALALVTPILVLQPAVAADEPSAADQPAAAANEEKDAVVKDGRTVSIQYTLKDEEGKTLDTNVGGEPLVYEQGGEQILPALQDALEGMEVDESKRVTIPPEEGYGKVDPELVQEVDAEMIPEDAREPGMRLEAQDPQGNRRLLRVREVKGDKVVLDLNHPLAGETLHFDVKVLAIN